MTALAPLHSEEDLVQGPPPVRPLPPLAATLDRDRTTDATTVVRWLVLAGATAFAFSHAVSSVAVQAYGGAPLIYLYLLPLWAGVLACGTGLHRRQELAIHDRQVDWIVAVLLGAGLWMLDGLLAPRLGATANLVRVDLFGMVLFVAIGCVLLFGTRATGRYWATWLFVLATWPLAYGLVGAALGGSVRVYAVMNVGYSVLAVVVARGRGIRGRLKAAVFTGAVGIGAVVLLGATAPPAVAELAPSLACLAAAAVLAATWRRGYVRAALVKRQQARKGTTRAVRGAWPAVAALCLLAVAVAYAGDMTPSSLTLGSLPRADAAWTPTPVVPAGWKVTSATDYPWATNYFGLDAGWQRAWYRADVATAGSPSRTARLVTREPVVVDALTTPNPGTLSIYPAAVCYRLAAPYLQATETVSLGHGIRATVDFANPFAAVSPTDAQWVLLTWTWRIPQTTYGDVQRITVLTLDGTPNAKGVPVPAPPGANDGVRSTFTDILRGASTEGSPTPSSSAMGRLTAFARAIVAHQVHTAQVGNR